MWACLECLQAPPVSLQEVVYSRALPQRCPFVSLPPVPPVPTQLLARLKQGPTLQTPFLLKSYFVVERRIFGFCCLKQTTQSECWDHE